MRNLLILGLIAVLAACAPRAAIVIDPEAAGVGAEVDVYVASSRRELVGRDPGEFRSFNTNYYLQKISIPPDRAAGSISFDSADPSAQTDFVSVSAQKYASGARFRQDIRRALAQRPRKSREIVVYIHGFNNTFADGVFRIAQLSHDLELPGVAVHYSWPSAANPLGYVYDRDSMLFARDGLERLFRDISDLGADRILVVAHSLGALLAMETLRQIAIADAAWPARNLDGVILISPDIDIDVFRAQARRIQPLPDRFAIFISERDRALRLSARLSGQTSRLGNIGDAKALEELDVVLLDVTEFSTGAGHFTAGSSPALLALLRRLGEVDRAFQGDQAGRTGLFPGTVLTVQNATQILLTGRQ